MDLANIPGFKRRLLRRNRMNHIGKLSFMSITSPSTGYKVLCTAKLLFFQEISIEIDPEISRTSPSLPEELDDQSGPEIFKGWRRACAPRHIPDRFPVTAGTRSETATRPLGSALFSRLDSQRRTAFSL